MYKKAGHHQKQDSFVFRMIKRLSREAGKYYCHIWAIFYGLGIFSGTKAWNNISIPGYMQYIFVILMFLILGGSIFIYIRNSGNNGNKTRGQKQLLLIFVPALIFFMCGYLLQAAGVKPVQIDAKETKAITREVRVQGRVCSHPETVYGSIHLDIVIESSNSNELKRGDTISVVIKRPKLKDIYRDDVLDIVGELKLAKNIPVLEAWSVDFALSTDRSLGGAAFRLRQRFYKCISGAFSNYLKTDHAALARALILGDRRYLTENQYDIFKQSGTAHLIAISGMHISFLAAIIYLVLGKVFRKPMLLLMLALILLFYNFILGSAASVMRATIWVLGAAAASSWNRKFRPSYILCISFIFLSILEPGFVKQAGFWLSFSAMAGIVFIYPGIKKLMLSLKVPGGFMDNHIVSTILVTISIQLFCGPLTLYYFGSLPLISPIANLAILPFFYILILLLFIASAVCIIWPPAGGIVLQLVPFIVRPVYAIARIFSHPRFPSIEVDTIQAGKLFIYYFTILAVLFIIKILTVKRFDFWV
jgi:ComEC/Rec2-related protein